MDSYEVYVNLYLEEVEERIAEFEQKLILLEEDKEDLSIINDLFRVAHSLKGASATMGFTVMSDFAHKLEDLMGKIRENELKVDLNIMDLFFESIDKIKKIKEVISSGSENYPDISRLIDKIDSAYKSDKLSLTKYRMIVKVKNKEKISDIKEFIKNCSLMGQESEYREYTNQEFEIVEDSFELELISKKSKEEIQEVTSMISNIDEMKIYSIDEFEGNLDEELSEEKEEEIITEEISEEKKIDINKNNYKTIKIDISKIDKLLNLVGEFIIERESMKQIISNLKQKYQSDYDISKISNIVSRVDIISSNMQETVMGTRMMPLENIFGRFPRMVRDLSTKADKKIRLIMQGEETEIDRGMIEELVDPITHIIRNAVDHGIEASDKRKKMGKNRLGIIYLRAKHEENSVVIEIEDDGKGIDVERIKKKAIERKLISKEEAEFYEDDEIIKLIFEPGFSTKEEVTELSGRGFGMDVVKSNIKKISGTIDVKTVKNVGTKFTIKLPLTLAIIRAMLIKEGNYTLAVPLFSVVEIMRFKGKEIEKNFYSISGAEVLNWRGSDIPIIDIKKYFDINIKENEDKKFIMIISYLDKKYALLIEEFLGEHEIVIKSMAEFIGDGKILGKLRGVSGVSILGDGSFAQILDVEDLVIGKKN